jgi:hypothetical protein
MHVVTAARALIAADAACVEADDIDETMRAISPDLDAWELVLATNGRRNAALDDLAAAMREIGAA